MRKYTVFLFREPFPGCQSNPALRELSLFSSWGSRRKPMQMAVPTDDGSTSSRNLLCVQFGMSALISIAAGTAQDWLRDPGEEEGKRTAECAWVVPTPSVCVVLASPHSRLWVPQQISSSAAPWEGTDPTFLWAGAMMTVPDREGGRTTLLECLCCQINFLGLR